MVELTKEFKLLFEEYEIDYNKNIKEQILNVDKAEFFKRLFKLLSLTMQMRNSITNSETDYLISPVKSSDCEFFDSRNKIKDLPENADANGAYNIARKALWAVERIKSAEDDELMNVKLSISNKEWLKYAQGEK